MRTYSRAEWEAAQAAWAGGEFSDQWREVRHQAAMRGMIFPPSGSRWDSWDDAQPSQRAILIRAVRDTPGLLRSIVERSSSWSQVVVRLMAAIAEWREEVAEREADAARQLAADRVADRRSMSRLADVMATMSDSGSPIASIAARIADQREQDRLERILSGDAS